MLFHLDHNTLLGLAAGINIPQSVYLGVVEPRLVLLNACTAVPRASSCSSYGLIQVKRSDWNSGSNSNRVRTPPMDSPICRTLASRVWPTVSAIFR